MTWIGSAQGPDKLMALAFSSDWRAIKGPPCAAVRSVRRLVP
jgi:hypothetical protein